MSASDGGGEAFAYEPHPNMLEQRELRKEYRALLASAQTTRRHLPESSISDLGDMVRLGDELYTKGAWRDSSSEGTYRQSSRLAVPAKHVRHGC